MKSGDIDPVKPMPETDLAFYGGWILTTREAGVTFNPTGNPFCAVLVNLHNQKAE